MSFDLGDYVDVAERIRIFRDKHPDGSLQSSITLVNEQVGDRYLLGVMCQAWAYRSGDDPRPGIGHSFLEIPGKTPYTKDSEVENAETSAWGRAIVAALAADTKKVASADEVRAKDSGATSGTGSAAGSGTATTGGTLAVPQNTDSWVWPFGKHKGKTLADTPNEYLDWFLEKSDKEDIKDRIREFRTIGELATVAGGSFSADSDIDGDSIPFAPTIDGLGN